MASIKTNADPSGILVGEYGKPRMPGIEFSVSHTDAWVACAISSDPVGIDVETLPADDGDDRLPDALERSFSRSERAWLESLPLAARRLSVYFIWTRKEAYLKALGLGIPGGLDSFSAVPSGYGAFERVDDPRRSGPSGWVATMPRAGNSAVISVCVLGARPRKRLDLRFLPEGAAER